MVKRRGYVESIKAALEKAGNGGPLKIGSFVGKSGQIDPIADRYLDRLGMFGGDLAHKVATFYSNLLGIRLDMERIAQGEFPDDRHLLTSLLDEDLSLWGETEALGLDAVKQLRELSGGRWKLGKPAPRTKWTK